jgi:Domain of unknown function (DUF6285)
MNDRPTAAELIAAVRGYLEQDLLPTISDPRQKFQTLVAANVLAISERELAGEEQQLQEEREQLGRLLELGEAPAEGLAALRQSVRERNAALCARIRAGEFDEASLFAALCKQLRPMIERKLEVANPRYLAGIRAERAAPP